MSNFGNNNKDNGGGFLGYRYFIDAAQRRRNNNKYNKQYKNARNNKSEAFKMESEYIANSFNDIKNLVEKHYNDNKIVKNDKKTIFSFSGSIHATAYSGTAAHVPDRGKRRGIQRLLRRQR